MVPGEGPMPALSVIVGEAPGREEEQQGRPFVGQSGRMLEMALQNFGYDRSSFYITNAVKQITLDSQDRIRRPYQEEIDGWNELLQNEIWRAAPRVVLTLGTTAYAAVTGQDGSVEWGRVTHEPLVVVPAWHPAFVLQRQNNTAMIPEWLGQLETWAEIVERG